MHATHDSVSSPSLLPHLHEITLYSSHCRSSLDKRAAGIQSNQPPLPRLLRSIFSISSFTINLLGNFTEERNTTLIRPSPDTTPKAISHRIQKLRSMADGHTTATSSSSPGLGLLPIVKRGPKKRARSSSAASSNNITPTKATGLKLGSASSGSKRTNSGKAKIGGSPLKHENMADDDEDVMGGAKSMNEVEVETPTKVC